MELKTIRVVGPEEAGGYVVINECDFDEQLHQLFEEASPDKKPSGQTAAELKAELDAKGIAYKGNASKAELQALLDAAPQA